MRVAIAVNVSSGEHFAKGVVGRRQIESVECHPFLVIAHIQLVLLFLYARCLNGQIYHAVVLPHLSAHIFGYTVQTVVIIASQYDPVATVLQVEGIGEASLADTTCTPVGTTDRDYLSYDFIFQHIGKGRMLILFLEIYRDGGSPPFHPGFKTFYLGEACQEILQYHHLFVELGRSAAQRHLSTDVETQFTLVAMAVGMLRQYVAEEVQTTGKGYTYYYIIYILPFLGEANVA